MNKLWNIGLRWCKLESPRLEISLFHYFKGDALYFIYIQLYKLIFSVSFDIHEYDLRNTEFYEPDILALDIEEYPLEREYTRDFTQENNGGLSEEVKER